MPLQIITAYSELGVPYTTWINTDVAREEPGPQILDVPQLDFSDSESPNIGKDDSNKPVEQGYVNAKAYYRSQGQDYNPQGGSDLSTYTSDWTPDHGNPDEWWKDRQL